MEDAATRVGMSDGWKFYIRAKEAIAEDYGGLEGAVKSIRQILKRHNPEAMFCELAENNYSWLSFINTGLDRLKSYGYDARVVEDEVIAALRLIAKQSGQPEKHYQNELGAALSFAWLEKTAAKQRYLEYEEGEHILVRTQRAAKVIFTVVILASAAVFLLISEYPSVLDHMDVKDREFLGTAWIVVLFLTALTYVGALTGNEARAWAKKRGWV